MTDNLLALGGRSLTATRFVARVADSAAEMQQLKAASGAAFDKLWLQMMTKHHQGVVEMAQTELAGGQYQPAKELAQSIGTSQAKEISTMQALLSSLS